MKSLIIQVTFYIFYCASIDALNNYQDEDESVGTFLPRENYYNYQQPYPQPYPQHVPDPYSQPYPRAYPYNHDGGQQEFEGRAFRFPPFKMVPIQFPSFGYFDRPKESPQPMYPPPPPTLNDQITKGRKFRKMKKAKKVKDTPNTTTDLDQKIKYPTKCNCANQ